MVKHQKQPWKLKKILVCPFSWEHYQSSLIFTVVLISKKSEKQGFIQKSILESFGFIYSKIDTWKRTIYRIFNSFQVAFGKSVWLYSFLRIFSSAVFTFLLISTKKRRWQLSILLSFLSKSSLFSFY